MIVLPITTSFALLVFDKPLNISFNLEGELRFDSSTNKLYVKPKIVGDIIGLADRSPAKVLLAMLSDIEYPIQMQKLNPIIGKNNGQQFQADIVVVGKAQVELTGEKENPSQKIVQASIIAKALKVADGSVLATSESYIPATDDSEATAQQVALEKASSKE